MLDRAPGRYAVAFILFSILLDAITFGIIVPVMPALITDLTGEGLGQAAAYGGMLMFIHAFMQFLFAPLMGNVSDRYGRRPVLLMSMLVLGTNYIIMGFAPTLAWLFAGRLIAGIAGSTITTANAYMADISTAENRAKNFGLITAAGGLGFILGPVIGGFLGEYGPRVPFFFAAGLAFTNFVYGAVVLPETLKKGDRRAFSWARANTLGAVMQMRQYPVVIAFIGVMFFLQTAQFTHPSVWSFYTMLKFDWTVQQVGISLGVFGGMTVFVQGFALGRIVKKIGEQKAVFIGLTVGTICFFGFGSATQGWMIYAWLIPAGFTGLAMPALRSIVSNQVPANAQGELQGAITSLFSLTAMLAPLGMTQLFRVFTEDGAPMYVPGAPFYASSLFVLISLLMCLRILRKAPLAPAAGDG
ncbi:MAG: TCR/Tet family MFS transporter [Rhodospirillaceae bacterium]